MSYEGPNRPKFTRSELTRRSAVDELDAVTMAVDVRTDDDELVPAGTVGTVVAVWGDGEAFEVEFDDPIAATATVKREMIRDRRQSS